MSDVPWESVRVFEPLVEERWDMSQAIHWEVPDSLYRELVWAQNELEYPDLIDFIRQAVQRHLAEIKHEAWQHDFGRLQQQIRASGGFGLGETKEEVIANLHEIRRQVYEEEYAHLCGLGSS